MKRPISPRARRRRWAFTWASSALGLAGCHDWAALTADGAADAQAIVADGTADEASDVALTTDAQISSDAPARSDACGGEAERCCAGSTCLGQLACRSGACLACGIAGGPCCGDGTCAGPGVECSHDGQCAACGGVDQPCCNDGAECVAPLSCHGHVCR